MSFYDIYDFNPARHRSWSNKLKVAAARHGMPGAPFKVYSVSTAVTQSVCDSEAQWAGSPGAAHAKHYTAAYYAVTGAMRAAEGEAAGASTTAPPSPCCG